MYIVPHSLDGKLFIRYLVERGIGGFVGLMGVAKSLGRHMYQLIPIDSYEKLIDVITEGNYQTIWLTEDAAERFAKFIALQSGERIEPMQVVPNPLEDYLSRVN
jgi:hypothetical protein